MTDLELVRKYKPYIWGDKKEPFPVTAVGYTLFRGDGFSTSFPKRRIEADWKKIDFVLEYAVWFDYDIQHMYDLEHLWVYVDKRGFVVEAEGSFHGKYLRMISPVTNLPILEEETHINAYCQPGKHAFLPIPELFKLIPDWRSCCMEQAGKEGVLIQDMYADKIHVSQELQKLIREYIKENFGFTPSMEFQKSIWKNDIVMPWKQLSDSIPNRVNTQIALIKESYVNKVL